ncbi:short chain dehydrogenase [Popillia japonica]
MGAKTPIQGAQTVTHLALSEEFNKVSGKFFIECEPFIPPKKAQDLSFREAIWKASEYYVRLRPYEKLRITPVVRHPLNLLKK